MSKASFKRMMRQRRVRTLPVTPTARTPWPPQQALVYEPPTDEQLANFVAAMVTGAAKADGLPVVLTPSLADLMLRANPMAKHGWLQRHREMQMTLNRLAP